VSVDAIEHWMIYREHPDVGAIVHVHGWIDGTTSTEVNYPCGTEQLACAVAELVRAAPDETPMLTDIERAERLQELREAIRARARGDA
jgi:ribulose-5-phosphate 4-epimerase/fuculose-1-phosphate aldolase